MIFEREDKKPINDISEKQLIQHLRYMKRHTGEFAILSESDAEYIQMMGGGVSSCVELHTNKRHHRAYKSTPHVAWNETTLIRGNNQVEPNECLLLDEVIELFTGFYNDRTFPSWVMWWDMTEDLKQYGVVFEL